jgi:hypothetical protein
MLSKVKLFAAIAALLCSQIAHSAELRVPAQYPTIQSAVNAAVTGDTVLISPGTYNERVAITGKSVVLRGERGAAAQTIINAAGTNWRGVEFAAPLVGALCGLYDLTITHAGVASSTGVATGLYYESGGSTMPIVIERCIFRDNLSTNIYAAGAIDLFGSAIVRDCIFSNNRAGIWGNGIYLYDGYTAQVDRCVFRDHASGNLFYARNAASMRVRYSVFKSVGSLCAQTTGTMSFGSNFGCGISSFGAGYVNLGSNDWSNCPDCNANGTLDLEEVLLGASDCNRNYVPDSCDLASAGFDANGDGVIDACEPRTERLVPSQYATVQAAVDASRDGDTVRIAPGIYTGRIEVQGKSVALRGQVGRAADTVLSAGTVNGPTIYIGPAVDGALLGISDLTLTHSSAAVPQGHALGYQGGIDTEPLLVERCIIRDTYSTNAQFPGGADVLGHVIFRDCIFSNNRSVGGTCAISVSDLCSAVVERCVFRDHAFDRLFYTRNSASLFVRDSAIKSVNVLCGTTTGISTFFNTRGCGILSFGSGFADAGSNGWGACPDCDGDGIMDLEELLLGGQDCDSNGVLDTCQILAGTAPDANGNMVIDTCECMGDITGNGFVDGVDLAAVLGSWGASGSKAGADLDGDGIVGGTDLAIVLGSWGACP